jgi:hypothetical protein
MPGVAKLLMVRRAEPGYMPSASFQISPLIFTNASP